MKIEKHKELYSQLMNTKLNFIEPGQYHVQEIYREVKKQFYELCDDEIICADICTQGTLNPEWQHRVRSALQKLKSKNGGVSKGDRHGYWIIHQAI